MYTAEVSEAASGSAGIIEKPGILQNCTVNAPLQLPGPFSNGIHN